MTRERTKKTISEAITEWESHHRRMGCVAATDWFCQRVSDFEPIRLTRYTAEGEIFEHVVVTNGKIRIDLAPYADQSKKDISP